jgi:hypothetical protein
MVKDRSTNKFDGSMADKRRGSNNSDHNSMAVQPKKFSVDRPLQPLFAAKDVKETNF